LSDKVTWIATKDAAAAVAPWMDASVVVVVAAVLSEMLLRAEEASIDQ